LRLLDLTARGSWGIRNGAAASLPHAAKATCRAWARTILDAYPELDGLYSPSTMTGNNVVLFPHGIGALPASPSEAYDASDPAVKTLLHAVARKINHTI